MKCGTCLYIEIVDLCQILDKIPQPDVCPSICVHMNMATQNLARGLDIKTIDRWQISGPVGSRELLQSAGEVLDNLGMF
ncbi:hypothetical protein AVEN_98949-1 [Araneus ventricosus]|uniref:Uncharacterized protein n=1 Tax=Araneus ventricosus TaxID=182803 RepID=A0A4Y2F7D9_ARAVE|nr:hypothetical protein AVEN_98949-1 [Araneus ventricosus]